MYHVLYNDVGLVGVTTESVQVFPGISYLSFDGNCPDLSKSKWNSETLQFDTQSSVLSKREFLARFSLEERTAIRASNDSIVKDLMFLLDAAEFIDVTDTSLQQGIYYLSMIGLITSERMVIILGDNNASST